MVKLYQQNQEVPYNVLEDYSLISEIGQDNKHPPWNHEDSSPFQGQLTYSSCNIFLMILPEQNNLSAFKMISAKKVESDLRFSVWGVFFSRQG